MFSPAVVLACLLEEFGPSDTSRFPTRQEKKMASSSASILRDAQCGSIEVEDEEGISAESEEEEPTWSVEEDDEENTSQQRGSFRFGEMEVSKEKVDEAIMFYRSTESGTHALSSMQSRVRFTSSDCHPRKLRRIERDGSALADQALRMRTLTEKLKEAALLKLKLGLSLHASDLREMALTINYEDSLIDGFKASHRWLQGLKRRCGIVSRRVTTFISRIFQTEKQIVWRHHFFFQWSGKRWEMSHFLLFATLIRAGSLSESTHSARSLALLGSKRVERVVQSVSATTHLFTVMPLLYADGLLGDKLFVVMQEPRGTFPAKGIFEAPNLVIRANTTHIMINS